MAMRRIAEGAKRRAQQRVEQGKRRIEDQVGGPARLHIILLLAGVLALDMADKAAVSAVAGSLKQAFQISNTQIGLLISVVSLVGAIATLPVGVLVDRTHRTRLLVGAITLWAVAMVVSGTATSFVYLLISRVFLGAVTAVATPAVASLTGDFFPARERAAIYGYILTGELIGTGFGFLLAGLVSSWLGWRWAFYLLAVPSAALAWLIWRYLPEPARAGQNWLALGQEHVVGAEDVAEQGSGSASRTQDSSEPSPQSELAQKQVAGYHIKPREHLVLQVDPLERNLWWAVRYVLKIRTNMLLIIASALGYYFFAGVRAFAMIYITAHYDLSRTVTSGLMIVVGLGAVVGALGGGRLADWLLRRGWLSARVLIPGAGLLLAVLFMAPALWTTYVPLAVVLLTLGAAMLGAVNPPLDSARLDIMHPRLWGRAESVRITLRMFLEAAAPVVFGLISVRVFGGGTAGLKWTFLLMLLPVLVASSLSIPARRSYPRDVATASASLKVGSESERRQ